MSDNSRLQSQSENVPCRWSSSSFFLVLGNRPAIEDEDEHAAFACGCALLRPRDPRRLQQRSLDPLLRRGGFEILRTDFLFIFPRVLGWLRPFELLFSRWPLGAQYQVLCRKPPPIKEGEVCVS